MYVNTGIIDETLLSAPWKQITTYWPRVADRRRHLPEADLDAVRGQMFLDPDPKKIWRRASCAPPGE